MNVGFERINPIPEYPPGVTAASLHGLPWNSGRQIVISFKNSLKASLRITQKGRCCFCRRLLYDDYAAHLEHFIDQASYEFYRFEIRNLAISCGTCNVKKNGYFATWSKRYRRLIKNHTSKQAPTLKIQFNAPATFPTDPGEFRWVNPYVHNYSEHITLSRGWIFNGGTPEGRRTIRGLRLNELAEVERRALTERLEMRGGLLSMLVAALPELNQHRAQDAARAVAAVIIRRRKATATLT